MEFLRHFPFSFSVKEVLVSYLELLKPTNSFLHQKHRLAAVQIRSAGKPGEETLPAVALRAEAGEH